MDEDGRLLHFPETAQKGCDDWRLQGRFAARRLSAGYHLQYPFNNIKMMIFTGPDEKEIFSLSVGQAAAYSRSTCPEFVLTCPDIFLLRRFSPTVNNKRQLSSGKLEIS